MAYPVPCEDSRPTHALLRKAEKLAYCQQEGLVLEVERLKQLIHHCETELLEMDAIEHYRKDEHHVPNISIE